MKQLIIFLLALASLTFAATDTLYDTAFILLDWKLQPSALTIDKQGNLTAQFSSQIMQALPYDSVNGNHMNIYYANNVWTDSVQQQDSVKFPTKTASMGMIRDSLFQHCKKWGKKQIRTNHRQ